MCSFKMIIMPKYRIILIEQRKLCVTLIILIKKFILSFYPQEENQVRNFKILLLL